MQWLGYCNHLPAFSCGFFAALTAGLCDLAVSHGIVVNTTLPLADRSPPLDPNMRRSGFDVHKCETAASVQFGIGRQSKKSRPSGAHRSRVGLNAVSRHRFRAYEREGGQLCLSFPT